MNLKLDGSGVATIAAIGIGGYLLYLWRPWEKLNNTIDGAAAAVENMLDGDDNGQLDFMEWILGGQSVNLKNLSDMERVYEIDTSKDTINKAFIGSKPFAVPADQVKTLSPSRGVYAAPLPTPLGRITASGGPFWTTDAGRRNAGTLHSDGKYSIFYGHEQTPKNKINGDPRALYCLDALIKAGGLRSIRHAGMTVFKDDMKNDYGHRRGHAIDIYNEVEMNKLLEGAKALGMPVAWISKHKALNPLNKRIEWPKFMLRNGIKTAMGFSSVNHDSHYHLILPRPNRALGYWIGSPFQSGSWHPAPTGGGGGGSSDWGTDNDGDGFIPDNNGGPPPISNN